jgi:hypothetical protein
VPVLREIARNGAVHNKDVDTFIPAAIIRSMLQRNKLIQAGFPVCSQIIPLRNTHF